jgi:hypothetical protein
LGIWVVRIGWFFKSTGDAAVHLLFGQQVHSYYIFNYFETDPTRPSSPEDLRSDKRCLTYTADLCSENAIFAGDYYQNSKPTPVRHVRENTTINKYGRREVIGNQSLLLAIDK